MKKQTLLILSLLLLFTVFSCKKDKQGFDIKVKIKDKSNGASIANAQLLLVRKQESSKDSAIFEANTKGEINTRHEGGIQGEIYSAIYSHPMYITDNYYGFDSHTILESYEYEKELYPRSIIKLAIKNTNKSVNYFVHTSNAAQSTNTVISLYYLKNDTTLYIEAQGMGRNNFIYEVYNFEKTFKIHEDSLSIARFDTIEYNIEL